MVVDAARFPGFFAVRGSGKVRAFATQQCGALLRLSLLGRNRTEAGLANFFARFGGTNVLAVFAKLGKVPVAEMLLRRQALKVFRTVVGLVAVDVVNLLGWVKRLQPARGHNAVHEPLTPKHQVAHVVQGGCVRLELSENFSAARHGVKVVEELVLDSVYRDAEHAVPLKVAKESSF